MNIHIFEASAPALWMGLAIWTSCN